MALIAALHTLLFSKKLGTLLGFLKILTKIKKLGSVTGHVIQAIGRLIFEDNGEVRRSAILHFDERQHPH